jgi:WD40 repeat protein/tRNA A-37 threonylcarbamoyl transferase component Bud32
MNEPNPSHPKPDLLAQFAAGLLDELQSCAVETHVAACESCGDLLDTLPDDAFVRQVRQTRQATDLPPILPHIERATLAAVAAQQGISRDRSGQADSEMGSTRQSESIRLDLPAALADHPRYRVLRPIGSGGMGTVYEAEHRVMARRVALKVISPQLLDKPEAVARFRREAKAAAQLTHPNIVGGLDAEQAGSTHFLVMEFLDGTTLARLVAERGPLAPHQAAEYVRQAALGLQHAFEHGMVHRDIKPQNLMLTKNGQVKVLDFGLARIARESSAGGGLTDTGAFMGTADYIAPEQARDVHAADIRSDIYSLGCTLYFLLAGRPPFPSGSVIQKVMSHIERTAEPLRDVRPNTPAELLRILDRMMTKDPAKRYQTPGEVSRALHRFLGGVAAEADEKRATADVRAEPAQLATGPAAGRSRKWFVAAAVLLVGIGLAVWQVIRVSTDYGHFTVQVTDPEIDVLLQSTGLTVRDRASGREYVLKRGGNRLASGDYEIQVSEAMGGLEFSTREFKIRRGGREVLKVWLGPEMLAERERAAKPRWDLPSLPDEERISGQPKELVAVLGSHRGQHWWVGDEGFVTSVSFNSDGRRVASGAKDGVVRIWDAATLRQVDALAGHAGHVESVRFVAGRRWLVSGGTDTTRVWDLAADPPRQIAELPGQGHWIRAVAVTADGKTLATACQNGVIRLWDLAGPKPAPHPRFPELNKPEHLLSMAMSSDGRFVAFGTQGALVWLYDLAGPSPTEPRKLQGHQGVVNDVAFSPDSKTLASGGGWGGDRRVLLWRLDQDAMPEPRPLVGHAGWVHSVAFSPDGNKLAAGSNDMTVLLWDLGSPEPNPVVIQETSPTDAVAFSPDGQALAVGGGGGAVRLWDLTASPPRHKFPPHGHDQAVAAVAVSRDGSTIVSGGRDGFVRLWQISPTGPREQAALRPDGDRWVRGVAISPDGRTIAAATDAGPVVLWKTRSTDPAPSDEAAAPKRNEPELLKPAFGHRDGALGIAFAADGSLVSFGRDNVVRVWDIGGLIPQVRNELPVAAGVRSIAVSPAGTLVALGCNDRKVRLWRPDAPQGVEATVLDGHGGAVTAVAFAAENVLVCGDAAGGIRLWALSGEPPRVAPPLKGGDGPIFALACSPDGRTVASAVQERLGSRVVLWDLFARQALAEWPFPGSVFSFAFAPDNRHLATGNGNGTIYVLRLENP